MNLSKYLLELLLQGYDVKMNYEKEANVAAVTLSKNGWANRALFKVAHMSWNDENIISAIQTVKQAVDLAQNLKKPTGG